MITPKLDASKFEELLDRRGRVVQWEEALTCSCLNMSTGQPNYDCKACEGKGFIYQTPIIAKAMVTSVELKKEWEPMAGLFEVGDAIMTVPKRLPVRDARGIPTGKFNDNPLFDVNVNDRIVLLDDEFKTSEVLVKGMAIDARPADTLYNGVITRIKCLNVYDSTTGERTSYTENTDFKLTDQLIEWLDGGKAPLEDTQYSVTYYHRPAYTVIATLPKPRHQDGQDLPRYVALRYLSSMVNR